LFPASTQRLLAAFASELFRLLPHPGSRLRGLPGECPEPHERLYRAAIEGVEMLAILTGRRIFIRGSNLDLHLAPKSAATFGRLCFITSAAPCENSRWRPNVRREPRFRLRRLHDTVTKPKAVASAPDLAKREFPNRIGRIFMDAFSQVDFGTDGL